MKKLTFIIAGLALMTACTEKVHIDLGKDTERLVVEGIITNDTMAHTVKLTTTTEYYYDQPAPTVSGAIVTLSDGITTDTLKENTTGSGIYQTRTDYYGVAGRTYTLNIVLQQPIDGHKEYTSTCEMKQVPAADSIQMEYKKDYYGDLDFWVLKTYFQEPPEENFYMFQFKKNGVMQTDTISEYAISDDRFFNSTYLDGVGIFWLGQDKDFDYYYPVQPGDTITLITAGITDEYYHFIMDVMLETGMQTPMFSGPPANVKGNINNGAIGFFAAYTRNEVTTIAR